MKHLTWIGALSFLLYFSSGSADYRQSRQSLAGVCRYGSRLECCYGWKKNSKGHCEAQCDLGCKHGECVGPNKCKCFPGYTGKTCSQDLNECGLKPRPCEHRCMNTFGSYMCYCLNGYMLMPDGSCANSRTCSVAHCQYGCEEVQGEIRCLCPSPGLQLGSDGKTCVDIDECVTGKNQCPFNRQCTNTFGSYYCKCQTGYDLKYVSGKYDCVDINECVSNTHKCSHHAECINTHGSYKCKCKQGFRGSGFDCSVKPFYHRSWASEKGNTDVFLNAIPDFPSKTRILGGKFDNTIPEPAVTESPRLHLQPFDYDSEVYISPSEQTPEFPEEEKFYDEEDEEEEEEEDDTGNQLEGEELNPRGDAFFPDEFGPDSEPKEIQAAPLRERFLTDCDFDRGACEWVQDNEDDLDWTVKYHENGREYYLALSGPVGNRKEQARMKLLLDDFMRQSSFCLTFDYRIQGQNMGILRVMLDNSAVAVWEKRNPRNQSWQSEKITINWTENTPDAIIFEAERGKSVSGEIGLDHVALISGPCLDDKTIVF
ncbi:epidermal growth factor-like protein 6 isoform X1 [Carassius gibelio]|uniref:epidermal growth factor-like protein 6 isoform X1 n=1 Tax=Carassius gibelio TaxID=101364 RepID=UPI0022779D3F|nr:epidermal growth factor-like protein 6 isoform X1 [Carassius gibelio]